MINRQQRKAIETLVHAYNKAAILKDLYGVINDIKANKWPEETSLFNLGFMDVNIAMVKMIPDWPTNPVVIQNMTSALIGRFLRAAFMQVGVAVDLSDPDSAPFLVRIAASTDAAQDAACRAVVGDEVHKYFKEHEHDVTFKLVTDMVELELSTNQTKH